MASSTIINKGLKMKRAMTIYYDEDSGELEKIDEAPHFKNGDSLLRADVLQDCVGTLTYMYENSFSSFTNDLEDICSDTDQMKRDFPSLFDKDGNVIKESK
jgi:hypothetical protein